jgi:glycerol-3-phosphate acyltransferase PlsY
MRIAAVLFVGYLLGSIPVGYLIVRLAAGADVRETGSGGTGATNVTRRAGRWAGILTLLLDAGKGAAAVLWAKLVLENSANLPYWIMATGFLAVVGHCFPVWLGFRGGKGVATAFGVLAVL